MNILNVKFITSLNKFPWWKRFLIVEIIIFLVAVTVMLNQNVCSEYKPSIYSKIEGDRGICIEHTSFIKMYTQVYEDQKIHIICFYLVLELLLVITPFLILFSVLGEKINIMSKNIFLKIFLIELY